MSNIEKQDYILKSLLKIADAFKGRLKPYFYKDIIIALFFLKYISDEKKDRSGKDSGSGLVISSESEFDYLFDNRLTPGNGERIARTFTTLEKQNPDKVMVGAFDGLPFLQDWPGVDEKAKNQILIELLGRFSEDDLSFRETSGVTSSIVTLTVSSLFDSFASTADCKAREFYTPPDISDLLYQLLSPKPDDIICDPVSGTASILIRFLENADGEPRSSMPFLFGQELSQSNVALAQMNILMNGRPAAFSLKCGDSIKNPLFIESDSELQRFDIAVANPPAVLTDWGYYEAMLDKFDRFSFGVPPKTKGNYAFILHMLSSLNDTGRMAVTVPQGILFRGAGEQKIRQQIIDANVVDCIVRLPDKILYRGNNPTIVMILNKNKTDRNVLFVDAFNFFKVGRSRNLLRPEDITKITDLYGRRENVDGISYLSTIDEIREKDYNLNVPKYISSFKYQGTDIDTLFKDREVLEAELKNVTLSIEECLEKVNMGLDDIVSK